MNMNKSKTFKYSPSNHPTVCILCGGEMKSIHDTHNPYPITRQGRCCTDCNTNKVILARINRILKRKVA